MENDEMDGGLTRIGNRRRCLEWGEAERLYQKAADQGDADAQFELGWHYETGSGVEKDESEAVRWYQEAADQGHMGAQFELGWHYETGRGVEEDESEAVRWYQEAADQGHMDAQSALERLGL